MTPTELREETELAERTVRRALNILEERGASEWEIDPQDLRKHICRYIPEAERDGVRN